MLRSHLRSTLQGLIFFIGTSGKVEWRDNWVTFLDSIFQFAQLGTGSQELCLPKKLKKLCINPQAHKQIVAALSDGAGESQVLKLVSHPCLHRAYRGQI
jgi:hypothetical protein